MIVVVGPCSIHNRESALEYARRLKALADKVADRMLFIMRVYFEKPRTTVGWKGLINDPHLNDTFDIAAGLRLARGILIEVAELGLPAATEMLEPITPQYIADLITLASIGARTTESPTHRQMASGLSMPVGYKNGTDGDLDVAINAMQAARSPHSFLGIDAEGKTCMVQTKGNPWGHLILRGGRSGPNYDPDSLQDAAAAVDQGGALAAVSRRLQPRQFQQGLHAAIRGVEQRARSTPRRQRDRHRHDARKQPAGRQSKTHSPTPRPSNTACPSPTAASAGRKRNR